MWKELLNFDTFHNGKGSSISKIIYSNKKEYGINAIAGVTNTGNMDNWTGHHFAQANWYCFGRLAWNPEENEDNITHEWIKMTWQCKIGSEQKIKKMMDNSWRCYADSHSPYSIGLTMKVEDHYEADFNKRANKEWYFGKDGIGYNRTKTGSDYVSQYAEPNTSIYNDINRCPENILLCFHKVPWNHKMKSGMELKEEIRKKIYLGVEKVKSNITIWNSLKGDIDTQRFGEVMQLLKKEEHDAYQFYKSAAEFLDKYDYNRYGSN